MRQIRYDESAEENEYYQAIPETPFETALLRSVLETAVSQMSGPVTEYTLASEDGGEATGWWLFYATRRPRDINEILNTPMLTGRIAVVERRYPVTERFRVIVTWEMDGQTNDCPYRPVLKWEAQ